MTKRSPLRTSLLSLAGVGGAAIATVALFALAFIPQPQLRLAPLGLTINPVAATPTKVCPGGLVDVITYKSDATTFAGFAAPDINAVAIGATSTITPVDAPDNIATSADVLPQLITVPASTSDTPNVIAATQSQETTSDVIAGLAAANCGEASTDQWLVGGSTVVGQTSLLFLTNALNVESLVDVQIFTENGRVDAPGMSAIVVGPHSQRILSLAAFAPDVSEPVVHVVTTGGQIFASIQQSVTRVIVPSGVELITPGAGLATRHIIPGVALVGQAQQDSEGGQVTSDLAPAIRVAIPGQVGAEVTATVRDTEGTEFVVKANVAGGHSIQLPFAGVPDGFYTVIVTADVPVVAGVRTIQAAGIAPLPLPDENGKPTPSPTPSRTSPLGAGASAAPTASPTTAPPSNGSAAGSDGGSSGLTGVLNPSNVGGDFTWNAAAFQLTADTLIPIPEGRHPTLFLYNPADAEVTVSLFSGEKQWKSVRVTPGRTVVLELQPGMDLRVKEPAGIFASVSLRGSGYGSAFVVSPITRLGSSVLVYPR